MKKLTEVFVIREAGDDRGKMIQFPGKNGGDGPTDDEGPESSKLKDLIGLADKGKDPDRLKPFSKALHTAIDNGKLGQQAGLGSRFREMTQHLERAASIMDIYLRRTPETVKKWEEFLQSISG